MNTLINNNAIITDADSLDITRDIINSAIKNYFDKKQNYPNVDLVKINQICEKLQRVVNEHCEFRKNTPELEYESVVNKSVADLIMEKPDDHKTAIKHLEVLLMFEKKYTSTKNKIWKIEPIDYKL